MAVAKKSAKKPAVKATRGHQYELTAKGAKLDPKTLRGQYAVLFPYLRKRAYSVREMAEVKGIAKEMATKQDPMRPIAFIFNEWKNEGVLKFATAAAKPARKAPKAAAQAVAA